MSSIKYVNLFIRGVPSHMEPQELAKVLSLYGEMNTRPCAFSVQYRRHIYNPYMSKEENANQINIVNSRYNVVIYGFKVLTDLSANVSYMFLNLIQMKRNIRHSWIDSARQPQFILISENNRPVPYNLFSQLLWSEDINLYSGLGCPRASYQERDIHLSGLMPRIEVKHPHTTNPSAAFSSNLTPIKQTVTFVEKHPQEYEEKKQEDCTVENNLNHAWIDAVEQRVCDTGNSEAELAAENRRIDDMVIKDLRIQMLYQSTEVARNTRLLLNSILRRRNIEDSDALQKQSHDYLVYWAGMKEQSLMRHHE